MPYSFMGKMRQPFINSDLIRTRSGISRVWQVEHVPWVPLEGGAAERFLLTF